MKKITEYITEYIVTHKLKNNDSKIREVWYTDVYRLPIMIIKNIDDYKQCYKQYNVNNINIKNEEQNAQRLLDDGDIVFVTPHLRNQLYCSSFTSKEKLEKYMDYICNMNIDDFNYDYMVKLKKKYKL